MDTLTAVVFQLGRRYQIFIPMVNKVLHKHKISHQHYDVLVTKITDGSTIADAEDDPIMASKRHIKKGRNQLKDHPPSVPDPKRNPVSLLDLQRAWTQCPRRVSKEDWLEWLKILNIDLIRESPALALRSCFPLAQACNSVARDMFNPAFLSCWNELNDENQQVFRISFYYLFLFF
jgi:FKBP12-rapamycin complex-associated protein